MPENSPATVKVFVDFWNVMINARNLTGFDIDLDWRKLTQYLVKSTEFDFQDPSGRKLSGCYIFGSYNPQNVAERKFIESIQDKYGHSSGLFFDFQERVKKETGSKCDSCGNSVQKASEVGIDVLLAVEMIKHAAMKDHDYLVLASSDRDYVPLLAYLKDKGERVVHASPDQDDRRIRSLTWKQVKMKTHLAMYSTIKNQNLIILSAPAEEESCKIITDQLDSSGCEYSVLDVANRDSISDRDLWYLMMHFDLTFQGPVKKGVRSTYNLKFGAIDLYRLRKDIFEKQISGPFPLVIQNGKIGLQKRLNFPTGRYEWQAPQGVRITALASLEGVKI